MDMLTKNWHKKIITDAQGKLGRVLSNLENTFITSREGYIALDAIEDTVKNLSDVELVNYLNSEHISD